MMGTLATLLGSKLVQTAVVYLISDKGGSWITGLLSRKGWLGYGTKAGKAVAQRRLNRRREQARDERIDWLRTATMTDDPETLKATAEHLNRLAAQKEQKA